MMLPEESIVSAFMCSMSVLLVLGLMLIPKKGKIKDVTEHMLFRAMCANTMFDGVFSGISYSLHYQDPKYYGLALFSKTVVEISVLYISYQWLMFADYKLYKSEDLLRRRYRIFFVPVAVFTVLIVINPFTGILFTIDDNLLYSAKYLYYIMMAFEYLYFLMSIGLIWYYGRTRKTKSLFNITPVMIPTILGTAINNHTDYSATALGFAVGMVFLYFSMMNSWRFDDENTGYFNRSYIKRILSESIYDEIIKGAISFTALKGDDILPNILKDELPEGSNIIRVSDRKYILLAESAKINDLRFLADMVEDACEEYNEDHSDSVEIKTECYVREKDEGLKTFIKKTA